MHGWMSALGGMLRSWSQTQDLFTAGLVFPSPEHELVSAAVTSDTDLV